MRKEKIYGICSIILLIDQVTKILITFKMKLHQVITVIPSFFHIHYVRNTGAAFSILEGGRYLLIGFAIIVFLYLQRYISKNKMKRKLEIISLGLLMGGLVGNLIDRLLYGYVIDFLSCSLGTYQFPIFNIADIAIVLGISLFIVDIINQEVKTKKEKLKC
ncbi:MAG: signal peptidase II [Bacilli bacterium]|nr:signal peptidase II [Bacilli bacterium]